jgi:hypothetical protein
MLDGKASEKPIFNIKYITIDISNIFLLVFDKGNQTKSVLYKKYFIKLFDRCLFTLEVIGYIVGIISYIPNTK